MCECTAYCHAERPKSEKNTRPYQSTMFEKTLRTLQNHAVIASDTRRDIGLVDYSAQPLTNSSNVENRNANEWSACALEYGDYQDA